MLPTPLNVTTSRLPVEDDVRRQVVVLAKRVDGRLRGGACAHPVAEAVDHQDGHPAAVHEGLPVVTAHVLAGARDADAADVPDVRGLRGPATRGSVARPDAGEDGRPHADRGLDVEGRRQASHRAEPRAAAARGRISVREASLDVDDAGPLVQGEDLDAVREPADEQLAALRVLEEVGRELGDHERQDPGGRRVHVPHQGGRPAPGVGDVALVPDRQREVRGHHDLHRVIVTRVPWPTVETISNSLESFLAPLSPSPRPPPVV
jgi:hypothetical protein